MDYMLQGNETEEVNQKNGWNAMFYAKNILQASTIPVTSSKDRGTKNK